MTSFRFQNVSIEAFAINSPAELVTSAQLEDRLAPLYERLHIPFGTLERLSGVGTRYLWDDTVRPSDAATKAAEKALERISFDRKEIGAVFNCSVTRDYFEPATATIVHRNLGLPERCFALDITNACVGFSNGITLLGNMIESGVLKAGLLVSGESVGRIIENCIRTIAKNPDISREKLLKLVPTLTLGSGAVAFVLCHKSIASTTHQVFGSVARTASEFSDLCEGNNDYCMFQDFDMDPVMETEASKLISSAAVVGGRTWREASEFFGWSSKDVDHIFCHQVGKQVNEAFYREVGLEMSKEFTIYRTYGNLVSAALPSALVIGSEQKPLNEGDKVVLLGYGSGLQSIFTALVW